MTVQLTGLGNGVWAAPGARIVDRSGRRRLPIGRDGFVPAMAEGTLIDKTMLIANVLDSGYTATLFCRPRRFGKTLNMTMLRAFLEAPGAGGLSREQAEATFEGTEVWEADGGSYRRHQGAYPVVHVSLSTAAADSWEECLGSFRDLMATEYLRHGYLRSEGALEPEELAFFGRVASGDAKEAEEVASLARLCRMLRAHHDRPVVLLVDEYDAPVMAGREHGYYGEATSFMRRWLTGAVKDGGAALAFACLTGVQRISKESIFSGLNNLHVSTPLGNEFDERYGFTETEVAALATYLGHGDEASVATAREWYDGYRFGSQDVYNPWSVLNYLRRDCTPDTYWGNTSGNSVVGELVAGADAHTLEQVYELLQPGGTVEAPLDLGIVFPELSVGGDAVWSLLYLAGYLTTDDTDFPNDDTRLRPLRVPNLEVARLFRREVVGRFRAQAGGTGRLLALQEALVAGDDDALEAELGRTAARASYLDLTSELACHMLVMGLLFGVPGYRDPLSNREAGRGRYDILLEPDPHATGRAVRGSRPLVTVEVKYAREADEEALRALADEALAQIAARGYDEGPLPEAAEGRLRWGVAFSGKRVTCASARA